MNYRPKNAYGSWPGLLLGLLVFAFTIWGINYSLDSSDRTLKILLYVPTYLFLIVYVYLIIGVFSLSYRIEKDTLVINWGFYKKRIKWDQVNEIIEVKGRANFFPLLSVSWSGYMVGLFCVKGLGAIKMFATYPQDGFIYLKTQEGLFGITPADHALITMLLNNTGKSLKTVDMDKMSSDEKGEGIHEDRFFNLYYKLNLIFLGIFAGYLGIFFPGSGAPKFIILLLVLAIALFVFNASNAKKLYQFSYQGAYITLLIGLVVTGIFIILSVSGISL